MDRLTGSMGHVDWLAASCTVTTFYTSFKLLQWLFTPHPPGIATPKRPGGIKGFLFQHMSYALSVNAGHAQLAWVREAGTAPIAYSLCLGINRILVPHPDDLVHVLMHNGANYVKPPMYSIIDPLLGQGLVTILDEDVHTVQRRKVSHAFSPLVIKNIANVVMREHAARLVAHLAPQADGKRRVAIGDEIKTVAIGIIAQAAFRTDILSERDVAEEFLKMHFDINPFEFLMHLVGISTTQVRQHRFGRKVAAKAAQRIIDEYREGRSPLQHNEAAKVLIDYLASADLSSQEVIDHCVTFMFAGYDTSSTALTWLCYFLAKHPDVQEKLFEEVSAAMSKDTCPNYEDLKKFKYMTAVINETLRVCPPVNFVSRKALKDDVLPHSGVVIPAGAEIEICTFVTHRVKEVWGEDADEYRPERWEVPGFEESLPPCSFLPFLAGKRNCIGKEFAMAEVSVVLAMLVRRFQMVWPEDEPEPFWQQEVVVKPRNPLHIILKARS